MGIDLINFHDNINGMFYGQKRKIVLDNLVKKVLEKLLTKPKSIK
jgi:hypothetical protein